MKIVAISDSHGFAPQQIDPCDLLVICGDTFPVDYHAPGRRSDSWWLSNEIERQINWFNIPFREWVIFQKEHGVKQVVLIAGNHDFGWQYRRNEIRTDEYVYLQDSAFVFEGLKIYGSPWSPWFYNWAFMLDQDMKDEPRLTQVFNDIPEDTDILLTHTPPFGILDVTRNENVGSIALKNVLEKRPNIKLHCFGHIHSEEESSTQKIGNTIFCNCSILNEKYQPVYKPFVFEI